MTRFLPKAVVYHPLILPLAKRRIATLTGSTENFCKLPECTGSCHSPRSSVGRRFPARCRHSRPPASMSAPSAKRTDTLGTRTHKSYCLHREFAGRPRRMVTHLNPNATAPAASSRPLCRALFQQWRFSAKPDYLTTAAEATTPAGNSGG